MSTNSDETVVKLAPIVSEQQRKFLEGDLSVQAYFRQRPDYGRIHPGDRPSRAELTTMVFLSLLLGAIFYIAATLLLFFGKYVIAGTVAACVSLTLAVSASVVRRRARERPRNP
jgi:hypothetical protein